MNATWRNVGCLRGRRMRDKGGVELALLGNCLFGLQDYKHVTSTRAPQFECLSPNSSKLQPKSLQLIESPLNALTRRIIYVPKIPLPSTKNYIVNLVVLLVISMVWGGWFRNLAQEHGTQSRRWVSTPQLRDNTRLSKL